MKMRNPYEILEVKETASKDEIKKSYRSLAKKYHPDQYGNNPLKDLAEDKMRELNEAYDYLMKNTPDASYSSSNNGRNYSSTYNNTSAYGSIEMDIRNGNFSSAEQKLSSITTRDAEWNYLMGLLNLQRGWYNEAYNNLGVACNLDPNNLKYRDALNKLNRMNSSYREPYNNNRRGNMGICDICTTLYCIDCCCECGGGDCISCC